MKPSTHFFPTDAAGTQWTQIANPVKPAKPAPIAGIAGIDRNGGAVDAEGLPPALEMGNLQRDKGGKLSNPDCGVGRGFVVPSAPRSSFTATADAFGMGASWWEDDYDRDAEKKQARAAAREARWDWYVDAFIAFWDDSSLLGRWVIAYTACLISWVLAFGVLYPLSLGVIAIWHAMGGK